MFTIALKVANELIISEKSTLKHKTILHKVIDVLAHFPGTIAALDISYGISSLQEFEFYDEMSEMHVVIAENTITLTSNGYVADKYVGSQSYVDEDIKLSVVENPLISERLANWDKKFEKLLKTDFKIVVKDRLKTKVSQKVAADESK